MNECKDMNLGKPGTTDLKANRHAGFREAARQADHGQAISVKGRVFWLRSGWDRAAGFALPVAAGVEGAARSFDAAPANKRDSSTVGAGRLIVCATNNSMFCFSNRVSSTVRRTI
ncbi:MAG: hypothetical protein ACJ746_13055 [Bryobacteraceae bacterium]